MSSSHLGGGHRAVDRVQPPGRAQSLAEGRLRQARQRGHNLYVPLANVEARLGQRISPEQVASTAAGNPARVVTITEE